MGLSKVSGSGIDDNVIVPANLHSTFVLPVSKLATGSGSGLDADTLDGQHGSYYSDYTNLSNKPTIPTINPNTVIDANYVATDQNFTNADHTKLDGIEAGATADQSASEILTAIKTVDGSGSGLDADTVDGQHGAYYLDYNNLTNVPAGSGNADTVDNLHASSFLRTDATDNTDTDTKTRFGGASISGQSGSSAPLQVNGFMRVGAIGMHQSSAPTNGNGAPDSTHKWLSNISGTIRWGVNATTADNTIWHAGNDGAGSGLDADSLHGLGSGSYLRSNASDSFSSTLTGTVSNGIFLEYDGSSASPYIRMKTSGTQNGYIQFTSTDTYIWNSRANQGFKYGATNGLQYYSSAYHKVWHAGNDGSGSGLDADTLDGAQLSGIVQRTFEDSSRNLIIKTDTTSTGAGIEFRLSNDTFQGQLYFNNTSSGFLNGSWASWDLQKTRNGSLSLRISDANYIVAPKHTGSYSGTYNIPIETGNFLYPNPSAGGVTITGSTGQITTPSHGNSSQWNTAYGYVNQSVKTDANPTFGKIHFDGVIDDTGAGAWFGRNHAYNTPEIHGYGAELMIGCQSTSLHINYRSCNNGRSSHTPVNWYWRQGSSTSWSNHYFGNIYANNNTVWHAGNDGAGSGLDADTLDGVTSGNLMGRASNGSHWNANSWLEFSSSHGLYYPNNYAYHVYLDSQYLRIQNNAASNGIQIRTNNGTLRGYVYANSSNQIGFLNSAGTWRLFCPNTGNISRDNAYTMWDAGNDGSGSGLDADTVKGSNAHLHGTSIYGYINGTYTPGSGNSTEGNVLRSSSVSYFSKSQDVAVLINRNNNGDCVSIRYGGSEKGSIEVRSTRTYFRTTSDYRLKTNVLPITNAADKIKALKPSQYNWIETGETDYGFLAHEIQPLIPGASSGEKDEVDENGDPVYQKVDQATIVPFLTAALKDALTEIDFLKERVEALEA